jgi:hypothetical protein
MGALIRSAIAVAFVLCTTLAGCGGPNGSQLQLVDGSSPDPVPAPLSGLNGAVMTRTRGVSARRIDAERLRSCEHAVSTVAGLTSVAVERTGFAGASLSFRRRSVLYGCNSIPDPVPDPDRPPGSVWCAGSVGRFSRGVLQDPRLSLCARAGGGWTAFVWVEPVPSATWIVLREADRRVVYETAASLPVRVEAERRLQPDQSATSFQIEQYDAAGRRLRAYRLDAAVAG